MSQVSALIGRLCPSGVAVKTLGELGTFVRGNGMQKTDLQKDGFPAIHYGQIHTHYGTSASDTLSFVAPDFASKLRQAEPGNLVIATTSEDDAAVGKAVAWLGETAVAVSGDAHIYRHSLDPEYVAHFFQSSQFHAQKKRNVSGTKVRRISGENLAKIRIPVPPIEVQHEIVRVLNLFQSLEVQLRSRLESESTARRAQYVHHRDALMAFHGSSINRVPLGELVKISRGASPRPIQNFLTGSDNGVPWIKIGDTVKGQKYITGTQEYVTSAGAAKSRRVRPGDFVLSNSMSFGRPYISKIEGCIHDGWLAISTYEAAFVPDFLYHLLGSAPVQAEFMRRAGSGTVSNLNAEIVRAVVVPVPTLEEQARIANILDSFEILVDKLSLSLSDEVKSRRDQYEFYRDQVLTFTEAGA